MRLSADPKYSVFPIPKDSTQLRELEEIYQVFDLYQWLSCRMPESFPDFDIAAQLKKK